MTHDVLNSLDEIKKTIISLQKDLKSKIEENIILSKKNIDLEDDIKNLSKVSLVAGLTRPVDEKNEKIKILEKQLLNFKNLNKKNSKLIVEDSEESENNEIEEGFEIIEYDNKKFLKNLENRKLYFIDNKGIKGKYAGKESKKGTIKLKD